MLHEHYNIMNTYSFNIFAFNGLLIKATQRKVATQA